MKDLFNRLRDNPGPRRLYDELMSRVQQSRCPYCSDREPETLDHYLSKAKFSGFAVLADNLIPCCPACNNRKGAYERSLLGTQAAALHPYFDDVSTAVWLRARIISVDDGPVARLFVDGAAIPEPELRAKAATHLSALRLKRYFKLKSAQELAGLDERMPLLLRRSGRRGVVDELLAQASQRSTGRANSWERALYEALAESRWYIDEYLVRLMDLGGGPDPRRPIPL